jgi:type II secretory pathway pseudopilin PulG
VSLPGTWTVLHNLAAPAVRMEFSRALVQAKEQASSETGSQRKRVRVAAAYTLLELILALALLGALMAVAWSLMGTFRDAEMRGWKLSHRTQTIRAAREWLQSDMQHLLQPELLPASTGASNARLNGNSMGFTALISPSIQPVPFLEQLMTNPLANTNAASEEIPAASLFSDTDTIALQAQSSLWPAETLNVEYQLVPQEASATGVRAPAMPPTDPRDTQFTLIRRELLDASRVDSIRNPNLNASQVNSDAERVLTGQDLYRQTETTSQSSGVAIHETRLDGLTHVQFQYFDGVSWRPEWNSDQSGGLPRAIALGFDFPARAAMKPSQVSTVSSAVDNAIGTEDSGGVSSNLSGSMQSFAESALAAEPTVSISSSGESSLMQVATHEVQIVVYVGGQASAHLSQQPFDSRVGGDF